MVHPLIGIHAALGEISLVAFVWVFIELLNPSLPRIKRAKIVALLGVIFLCLSWFAGGYYYIIHYGPHVKPIIKEGPAPYAHGIVMETKEHTFLFLPFLMILTTGLLIYYNTDLMKNNQARKAILALCITIIILGVLMAGMGYLISTSARYALEKKVL